MSILDNISSAFAELNETAERDTLISHPENIPHNLIIDNPDNIFSVNDTEQEIEELASSIATMGLIHRPAVSAQADGTYLILSGHRRVRAMRDNLQYETIPCEVYNNLSPDIESLIVYDANFVVRDNMTNEDKLVAYETYAEKLNAMKDSGEIDSLLGFTGSIQKYIAMRLGVSERTIRRFKKLSENLTEDERQKIRNGEMSMTEGKQIITERKEEKAKKAKEPKVYSEEQQEYINWGRLIYDVPNTKKDKGFACEFPKGDIYEKLFNYEEIGSWQFYEFLYERHKDEYKEFLAETSANDNKVTGNDL